MTPKQKEVAQVVIEHPNQSAQFYSVAANASYPQVARTLELLNIPQDITQGRKINGIATA